MKFKQFLDNYKIWRKKIMNPNSVYEKGDWKYVLWKGLKAFIPTLIFLLFFGL